MSNYHLDPRDLIVEVAARSGLLKKVANLIWLSDRQFTDRNETGCYCATCWLVHELTEAFKAHVNMPAVACEHVYAGCGFDIDIPPTPGTEAETEFETFYAKFWNPDQANAL